MSDPDREKPTTSAQTPPDSQGRVLQRSQIDQQRTHVISVVGASAPVVVSGRRDARVATVAAVQHGVVSRAQLRAAALGDSAVARMVTRGQLERLHRGVYRLSGASAPMARHVAALLACGPAAVLSHATAATLWQLPIPTDATVHVTLTDRQAGKPAGVKVHRSRTLTAQDTRHRHGLPLTSPARTLLDLAETLTPRQLERAVDEALVKHIVRPSQLRDVLARANGRHGTPALKRLLEREHPTTWTRSHPEEQFLALVRAARLPPPEVNAPLAGFNVDFLWRTERLAVEVDSWDYHRTRAKFEHDRRKGNAIQAAGYQLLRPTTDQLENEPTALVATVAGLLARAA